MRRYIYYLTTLLSVLLVSVAALGQPAGWDKLPVPTSKTYELKPGNYYLAEDINLNNARWKFGESGERNGQYTINLNGHTIDAKGVSGSSILNMASGTLTLIDEPYDGSAPDGKIINSTATCVYVGPAGGYTATFIMKGGTIENCQPSNGEGGAVEVAVEDGKNLSTTHAYFEMYEGAKITNCYAAQGAGVYVYRGNFKMFGGIITDNKIFSLVKDDVNKNWTKPSGDNLPAGISSTVDYDAKDSKVNGNYEYKGGGVYIESGTFIMSGGEISENVSINGGGVYVKSQATFELTGGTIKNNYATSSKTDFGNGGGIYIFGGSNCTITKGENEIVIQGNRVSKYGGAIYVNGSTVTLNGCSISKNYAGAGGGVAQDGTGCTLNLINCIVDGNYAKENPSINYTNEGSGGGLYIGNGGTTKNTLNIQSSTLSDNIAQVSGGGVYTGENTVITVKQGSYATLNGNTSNTANGGGIYQAGGTLTVQTESQLNVGTSGKPNKAPNGNGGGIYCAGTFTVAGNGRLTVGNNTAKNGGGICIENGTISLPAGENSVISNNSATELGGGLYVVNSTSANFNGGKFSYNTAKSGGAVAAVKTTTGRTSLNLGAEMEYNTASAGNGGGIYMNGAIDMIFGNGLIRRNNANASKTGYDTADGKDHTTVEGVGGGIFMGSGCTLKFTAAEMGIYDNDAENAGADICANGSNTSIVLPDISNMTLRDWNIPTTKTGLYWVEDYFTGEDYTDVSNKTKKGIRYQDALNDPNNDIYNYQVAGGRTYSNYLCLDLGYDLVFVKITTEGLDACDDASIQISYPRNENEGATDTNLEHYRKVLFLGAETKIVGLPSGKWNFEPTEWSYKYELDESRPAHVNGFIDIANSNSGGGTDGTDALTIIFRVKNKLENIREYNHRVVNRMVPKTQSGN